MRVRLMMKLKMTRIDCNDVDEDDDGNDEDAVALLSLRIFVVGKECSVD